MKLGLSKLITVGLEGSDTELSCGAGMVLGPSEGSSIFIIWIERSFVSTTLELGTVLGLQVAGSSCIVRDVVITG